MLRFIPLGILVFLAWPGITYYPGHFFLFDELNIVARTGKLLSTGLNPQWFIYPSLQIYLLFILYGFISLGYVVCGKTEISGLKGYFQNNPEAFILTGRGISFIATAVCALLIYRIAELYLPRRLALLPSLIFVLLKPVLYLSHHIKPDALMMALLLYSIYLFLTSEKDGLALFIAGLATGTKYNAGFIAALMVLLLFSQKSGLKKSIVGILSAAAGFILSTPFSVFTPMAFFSDLKKLAGMVSASGHINYLGFKNSLIYSVKVGLGSVFGSFGVFLIIFLLTVGLCRVHHRKFLVLPLSVLISIYVYVSADIPHVNYLYLGLPFICLTIFCPWSYKRGNSAVPDYFAYIVCAIIAVSSIEPTLQWRRIMLEKDSRDIAREWVFRNVEPGQTIYLENDVPPICPKSVPSCTRYNIVKIPVQYSDVTDGDWKTSIRSNFWPLIEEIIKKSDYVIVNSWNLKSVNRYPEKFPEKHGFYQFLKDGLTLKKKVDSSGIGPGILIYQNNK